MLSLPYIGKIHLQYTLNFGPSFDICDRVRSCVFDSFDCDSCAELSSDFFLQDFLKDQMTSSSLQISPFHLCMKFFALTELRAYVILIGVSFSSVLINGFWSHMNFISKLIFPLPY